MTSRVLGIETEYGISMVGHGAEELHPMHLSNHVVRGYGELVASADRWDYQTESPLNDQRGFTLDRAKASPDQLTDIEDGMANLVLTNGARLYVDHAHPEYSSPEVTTALEAVRFDKAGDAVMALAARAGSQRSGREIRLYKNNSDGKGASYGTHENYLLSRKTPFHRVVVQFTPFLVSRVPLIGAGRVGIGQSSERPGYQIGQRADYFEAEVGLETTLHRPIINTRDEPHADSRVHRRLHVITGDANQSEWATWLKVGTASLVLRAIEAGVLGNDLALSTPVSAMHEVSHDLDLNRPLRLADGRQLTALDLQEAYATACAGLVEADGEAEEHQLLAAWLEAIQQLRTDPFLLADRLDWVAKWRLLESFRRRDNLDWSASKLALVDLQYADVNPARSLYHALVAKGRMRRLVTDAQIEDARTNPPTDTRAYFRGHCMAKYADSVVAASWDSLIVEVPGRSALLRIPTIDPLRGTEAHVKDAITQSPDVASLVVSLGL